VTSTCPPSSAAGRVDLLVPRRQSYRDTRTGHRASTPVTRCRPIDGLRHSDHIGAAAGRSAECHPEPGSGWARRACAVGAMVAPQDPGRQAQPRWPPMVTCRPDAARSGSSPGRSEVAERGARPRVSLGRHCRGSRRQTRDRSPPRPICQHRSERSRADLLRPSSAGARRWTSGPGSVRVNFCCGAVQASWMSGRRL